jgi:hypothetical protein
VGIAGGRGGGSFYFSGIINSHLDKDPHLIYLDPHVTQNAATEVSEKTLPSFSCNELRTL